MRARNIKPGFFTNEDLGTLDPIICLTFAGLWGLADRDGILEDRPLRIKAELFPYRENLDVNGYLTVLERCGFIVRYKHGDTAYIQVVNFPKHQSPHNTEKAKGYPKPPRRKSLDSSNLQTDNGDITVSEPLLNGKITEQERPDSLIPDSLIQDKEGQSEADKPVVSRKPKEKFIPPTLEDVRQYFAEKKTSVSPELFYSHYEANGWVQSKGKPVVRWKSCLVTWEHNNFGNGKKPATVEDEYPKFHGSGRTAS